MEIKMTNDQSTISEGLLEIPRTGRIGRFAKIIEKEIDTSSFIKIMDGSDKYNSLSSDKKALWWKNAIEKMEEQIGREKSISIMNKCGSKCCGAGQRKTAKRLMSESTSITDFLNKIANYEVKEGELEYKLIDDNTIIARHNRCFCGQVKNSKEVFENDIYCQCSVEFNKQFFQSAFNKPVEVKLVQSILNGAPYCEFNIKVNDK